MQPYLQALNQKKPLVYCGDLNVAHEEIDIKNWQTNRMSAGFIDTFRYFYPDARDMYTWWSYMGKARENNTGWRIDYFIVSRDFEKYLVDAKIHMDIMGSDHCPVELNIMI